LAGKYAQEGLEAVRKIRNASYVGFRSYNGVYCLGSDETTLGTPIAACMLLCGGLMGNVLMTYFVIQVD
jgi:hypothetical protein